MPQIEALGVQLVAISVDSAEDSSALRERLGLPFPMLSDADLAVAKAYQVAMKGQDIAVPATMVVLPNREIVWKYVGEHPPDRPAEDIVIEQLEAAIEAAPAAQ